MKSDIINCASRDGLMASDDIADRISARASYSWTQEAYQKIISEITRLKNDISKYKGLVMSNTKRRNVFASELKELKNLKVR